MKLVQARRRPIKRSQRHQLHKILYDLCDPKLPHEVKLEITGAALDAVEGVIGVYVGNLEREYRRIRALFKEPIMVAQVEHADGIGVPARSGALVGVLPEQEH